ncbi:unnamed protein product, partial [Callosobruchus maculatus]
MNSPLSRVVTGEQGEAAGCAESPGGSPKQRPPTPAQSAIQGLDL